MGALQIINEGIKGGKGALSTVRNATRAADEALEAKRLAMEAANPPIKASEAYGKHEGAYLKPIFYDRMKLDLARNKLGGPGFSSIQLVDPNYAQAKAVAGVTDKKMGTRILNRNAANVPEGAKVIWTPSVGSLEQHKSNSTMFGEFADIFANQRKNMSAEQIQKLSDRASKEVDNNGRLIFPNGIDLGARNFRQQVKTYDQRALMANIFAGRGVGGEKGRTVPVEELLQKNLDPNMANAGTLDLGNRLFTLEGNVIDRPDLHTDYPKILTGEDLNVNYLPVPIRTVYNDWEIQKALELAAQGKNRPVTQMDYTKNDPTIQLTEELLTRLQKEGHAEGGAIHADHPDAKLKAMIDARLANAEGMAEGGEVSDADSKLKAMIDARFNTEEPHMGVGGLLNKAIKAVKGAQEVLPAAERDANLAKFLEESKVKDRMYHATNANFKSFRPSFRGAHFVTPDRDFANQHIGDDAFTGAIQEFEEGANIMPVNVQVKKPFDYEKLQDIKNLFRQAQKDRVPLDRDWKQGILEGNWDSLENEKLMRSIKNLGHDSFYVIERLNDGEPIKNLGIFDPRKIKSATGNRGTYDINEADITKANGGLAHFAAGGSSRRKADVTEALTEGLAPMLYGGAKGALASLLGFPGELEQLGRTGVNFSFGSGDGHRGIDVAEEPFLPNTKRVSGALPNWRGNKTANQVAEMGTDLGENIVGTMLDPMAALKGAKPILNAAKMLTGSRGTPSAAQAQRGVLRMPSKASAPQDQALLLAQQRAALPVEKGGLGLPANNTPEQRAVAMGFDKDTFHGSLNDIKKFDPHKASTESHAGKGVYSTDSPEDASLNYASVYGPDVDAKINRVMDERDKDWRKLYGRLRDETLTPRQQEILLRNTLNSDNLGVVYPLKVRSSKSIHLDAPEQNPVRIGPFEHYDEAADAYVDTPHTAKFNEALDEFRELGGEANPIYETVQDYGDAIPARDVFNAVKKAGNESGLYDPFTGDIVSGGVAAGDFIKHFGIDEVRHTPQFMSQQLNLGKEHVISLDPDNVRSRFAAFDPFRKSAAIAATMGVAAPDLLAKQKEKKKAKGGVACKCDLNTQYKRLKKGGTCGCAKMAMGGITGDDLIIEERPL